MDEKTLAEKLLHCTLHEKFAYTTRDAGHPQQSYVTVFENSKVGFANMKQINANYEDRIKPFSSRNDGFRRVIRASSTELMIEKAYEFITTWDREKK